MFQLLFKHSMNIYEITKDICGAGIALSSATNSTTLYILSFRLFIFIRAFVVLATQNLSIYIIFGGMAEWHALAFLFTLRLIDTYMSNWE